MQQARIKKEWRTWVCATSVSIPVLCVGPTILTLYCRQFLLLQPNLGIFGEHVTSDVIYPTAIQPLASHDVDTCFQETRIISIMPYCINGLLDLKCKRSRHDVESRQFVLYCIAYGCTAIKHHSAVNLTLKECEVKSTPKPRHLSLSHNVTSTALISRRVPKASESLKSFFS